MRKTNQEIHNYVTNACADIFALNDYKILIRKVLFFMSKNEFGGKMVTKCVFYCKLNCELNNDPIKHSV